MKQCRRLVGTQATEAIEDFSSYQVHFRAMLIEWNSLSLSDGYIIQMILFSCAHAYSYFPSFAEIIGKVTWMKCTFTLYCYLLFTDEGMKLRAVEKLVSFSKL